MAYVRKRAKPCRFGCGREYRIKKNHDAHEKRCTRNPRNVKRVSDEQKVLKCPICGTTRWTAKQMQNHIKNKHARDKK